MLLIVVCIIDNSMLVWIMNVCIMASLVFLVLILNVKLCLILILSNCCLSCGSLL